MLIIGLDYHPEFQQSRLSMRRRENYDATQLADFKTYEAYKQTLLAQQATIDQKLTDTRTVGKLLVCARIADEARVVLDGPSYHRPDVGDELVGNAAPAQKYLGNLAARRVDGVNADGGGSEVVDRFETLGIA